VGRKVRRVVDQHPAQNTTVWQHEFTPMPVIKKAA
jgi:hypothetical protein